MEIVILEDYQDAVRSLDCFALLAGHSVRVFNDSNRDPEVLRHRLAHAEAMVLIRERTRVDQALLDLAPKLRVVSQTGRLSGNVDLAACSRRGVAVLEGKGSPVAPAELTWALVMAAMRRVPIEAARLREGRWQTTLGRALQGRTLGIFGYGKIGARVAGYGCAFGMRLLAFGREGSRERAAKDGVEVAPDKATLFSRSDVLCLHLRLNAETRGIVSAADLALMKPDALLVNTSRAELLPPGALVEALRQGRPGFAAVDVYEQEPVLGGAGANPLLAMDNVLCTPHLGYVEKDSYELYFGTAFENLLAFDRGAPRNVANPEALQPRS